MIDLHRRALSQAKADEVLGRKDNTEGKKNTRMCTRMLTPLFAAVSWSDLKSRLRRKRKFSPLKLLYRFLPITAWLGHYKWRSDLVSDVVSGLTVAIMNVPQGGEDILQIHVRTICTQSQMLKLNKVLPP